MTFKTNQKVKPRWHIGFIDSIKSWMALEIHYQSTAIFYFSPVWNCRRGLHSEPESAHIPTVDSYIYIKLIPFWNYYKFKELSFWGEKKIVHAIAGCTVCWSGFGNSHVFKSINGFGEESRGKVGSIILNHSFAELSCAPTVEKCFKKQNKWSSSYKSIDFAYIQ